MVSRKSLIIILTAALVGYGSNITPESLSTYERDLGYVGNCERPPAQALKYCNGIIEHEIPASIARQADSLDFSINESAYQVSMAGDNDTCRESLKTALCKQRFPACLQKENKVVIENDGDCMEVIKNNCLGVDLVLVNSLCSNYSAVLYNGSCKTLAEHNTGQVLKECNRLPSDTKLTDWMFHFLTQMEAVMGSLSTLKKYGMCFPNFTTYQCSFGYCKGDRIKSRNTKESCNSMIG